MKDGANMVIAILFKYGARCHRGYGPAWPKLTGYDRIRLI